MKLRKNRISLLLVRKSCYLDITRGLKRPHIRYGKEGTTNVIVTYTNDVDPSSNPSSYTDALKDYDKEKWLEAMNLE